MPHILIIHGPNLNLLGKREPHVYGHETLAEINANLTELANQLNLTIATFQSNAESDLINRVQQCLQDATDFIILNPAAFTHTSIALRDALLAIKKPFIEVHLSNLQRRESWRHHSYFSDIALGTISGLGAQGYLFALRYAYHYLTTITQKGANLPLWTYEKLESSLS